MEGATHFWKSIPNYEGYWANASGEIKSKRKILKQTDRGNGYLCVGLYGSDGKCAVLNVHRIIAEVFLGKKLLVVDHIDGDKKNNRLTNLRYITHRENLTAGFMKAKTSSSYTGVGWHKGNNSWQARITISGKLKSLGYFQSEILAAAAYQKYLSESNAIELESKIKSKLFK